MQSETQVQEHIHGNTRHHHDLTAESVMKHSIFVSPEINSAEVLTLLADHTEITALPVVDHLLPIGLINRGKFMDEMAKPFRRDLFAKKSCIAFMDKDPLIVDSNLSIQDLSFKVTENNSKALKEGFLVTNQQGEYAGVGHGDDVMRVVAQLQAEKNELINESINYASVIQSSFLRSSREDMQVCLKDYFVHWEPRDKVGGDYYFFRKFKDGYFIVLFDCTGHGVPGAFMTLIMSSFIDHSVFEDNRHDPASILIHVNNRVKSSLGQFHVDDMDVLNQSDDGMDGVFCWVDTVKKKLVYSGAKTPLFYILPDSDKVYTLDGNKKGVGYVDTPFDYQWTNQEIDLQEGMCLYMTTDGVIDQIGGNKKISFGKNRIAKLLSNNYKLPMHEQEKIFFEEFYHYQGRETRRDDVCVIGLRIGE